MSLLTNLQGYWKLDEASGNATDSSANANTMLNQGTATYTAAKINNGVSLVMASSQYLKTATTPTNLNITGDISLSAWVKPTSIPALDTTFIIIGKFVTGRIQYRVSYVNDSSVGKCIFTEYRNTNNANRHRVDAVQDLGTGTFHHIVVTIAPSTQTIHTYVDGTEITTNLFDDVGSPTSIQSSTDPVSIGAWQSDSPGSFFNGLIDEVGIWDRVLTSIEVTSLYNGGVGLSYPFPSSGGSFLLNLI